MVGAEFVFGKCHVSVDLESGEETYTWEGAHGTVLDDETEADYDGIFNLGNLESGTYCLMETQSPDGYNLLAKPIIITVDSSKEGINNDSVVKYKYLGDTTYNLVNVSSGIYLFNIENTPGVILPMTGGSGAE